VFRLEFCRLTEIARDHLRLMRIAMCY